MDTVLHIKIDVTLVTWDIPVPMFKIIRQVSNRLTREKVSAPNENENRKITLSAPSILQRVPTNYQPVPVDSHSNKG